MFNTKGFMKASFTPRTEKVLVPALAHWFDEGEEPEWIVRGISSSELAVCNEATKTATSVDSVLKAIANNADKVAEMRKTLGIYSGDVPNEVIKRLQQLVFASIEPKVEHDVAIKLAETNPIEFFILTNKIIVLTGLGMDLAK